jgi:hypothetical protein
MQTTTDLSAETAQPFLNALPDKIKLGLQAYAAQVDYLVEAVLEMAIASFLDEDSMTFVGCNPLAGMRFEKAED